jgi:aspartyl-tRNA(Asn)/glutamyl-tRNA(Gln) amidotransferase subunit B
MEYEAVIGMEVHVELNTRSKVFCACSTDFHAPPNTHVCPICLGLPGAMPVLNREVVNRAVAVGLALNCTISRWSKMDRKNYFYPDLPKNYQISQYDLPLCYDGFLEIEVDGTTKRVGIIRVHMEEDTSRNIHTLGGGQSGIDFNRSGVPLLEIVTRPDLSSAQEAYEYLTTLKRILEYLEVSDCNMEEGSLRAEANISVRPKGSRELGTKTEVKNVASFSGTLKAIEYEVQRQIKVLREGGKVVQETRGWDADRGVTFSQRQKESAHDYRYFPEPDLVPVVVDEAWEQRIRESLPELPMQRKKRFQSQYNLSAYDAKVLTLTKATANYYEAVVNAGADPKKAANWVMGDLAALLSEADIEIEACKVRPEALAAMIALIENGTISGKIAKDVLAEMFETGTPPEEIVRSRGLVQITDTEALRRVVQEVLAAHTEQVQQFKSGKEKVLGYLVGQVMKATQGKGNPQLVQTLLREELQNQ